VKANAFWDVAVVGGGMAGLSAAIYLGRALRRTIVIDSGCSMARWEPHVQNYLGFNSISGEQLLGKGRAQAAEYGIEFCHDIVSTARGKIDDFLLLGKKKSYKARRVLLATGVFHVPPEIPCVCKCLGRSFFFCKDCDGYRVRGKKIAVIGRHNDTVEYALGMLAYSRSVFLLTNGKRPIWDDTHARWLAEYRIPVFRESIKEVEQMRGQLRSLNLKNGHRIAVDNLFTTRGDIVHHRLAKAMGAALDEAGEVIVDSCQQTTVRGLYAAGCVTPANCQMIIAGGQGATAAQAINRDLFEASLRDHNLIRNLADSGG